MLHPPSDAAKTQTEARQEVSFELHRRPTREGLCFLVTDEFGQPLVRWLTTNVGGPAICKTPQAIGPHDHNALIGQRIPRLPTSCYESITDMNQH